MRLFFIMQTNKIVEMLSLFQAYDPDAGENSRLRYYMDGRVQETLSENLDSIRRSPFLVDPVTGIVKLNFDPQKGMKGYFDFKVRLIV